MDPVEFFKGYLQQILLGPFLNTLSHLWLTCDPLMVHSGEMVQSGEVNQFT